jgi:hypothetical protein
MHQLCLSEADLQHRSSAARHRPKPRRFATSGAARRSPGCPTCDRYPRTLADFPVTCPISGSPVDCLQYLVAALGGVDGIVGPAFQMKGPGLLVVALDEAIDGLLQADLGMEGAAFESPPGRPGEEALEQARQEEAAKRLMTIPGVAPVVATAITATLGDSRAFASGRPLASGSSSCLDNARPVAKNG